MVDVLLMIAAAVLGLCLAVVGLGLGFLVVVVRGSDGDK